MVFSSAIFLFLFLPAVFLVYQVLPGLTWKNRWLALASLVFYAFGQLTYVPLFLCSALLNYIAGLLLRGRTRRKLVLTLAMLLNLGILCVFKYTDFFLGTVNTLTGAHLPLPGIVLPIGISFFTFQGMSYVIDVYRDSSSGTASFEKLLLYIAFFPQLIAGPIVKYHDISRQIDDRGCSPEATASGFRRLITGLGKKLLISNAAGYIADTVFDTLLPSGALDWRLAWLGGVCYTVQIYFDFSGYSDMAIGMGRMFGFTIKENFRYPYTAASMRDFWRRWHISLSAWFREYLYIPLGGNRRGKARTEFNRMFVFLCTGIWHGANWTFIVWGLLHGALTCLEDMNVIPLERLERTPMGRLVCRGYTLLCVMLLFVVFRADSLTSAGALIAAMFTGPATAQGTLLLRQLLTPAACLVLLCSVPAAAGVTRQAKAWYGVQPSGRQTVCRGTVLLASLVLLAVCMCKLALGGFNPFIYFQF